MENMNKKYALILIALAMAAPSVSTAQQAAPAPAAQEQVQTSELLKEDPKLIKGKLPNGVSYMIRPTAEPAGRACLRMYVNTGSLNETAEYSGVSHFLEHLVFNGSRHHKRGELIPAMEKLGLGFGGDANAYTSLLQTVFMLDLPKLDEKTVDFAFTTMRDFADGATLEPSAIEHERGIVISELKERDSEAYRATLRSLDEMTKGSRVAHFMPIGSKEVIATITPEQVQEYYRTNYTADRITVIVTGDVTPEQALGWIEKYYGDMPAKVAPNNRNIGRLTDLGPSECVIPNPENANTSLTLCISDHYVQKPDTVEQHIKDAPLHLAMAMLNNRLSKLARKQDAPFMGASTGQDSICEAADIVQAGLACTPEKWQPALTTLVEEIRKACEFGFSPAELKEVMSFGLMAAQSAIDSWDTVPAEAMASALVECLSEHTVANDPEESMRVLTLGFAAVMQDPDSCRRALAEAFDMKRVKLIAGGHLAEGLTPEALRSAFNEALQAPVQKDAEQAELKFAYDTIGAPGKVAQSATIEDLGVTTLTLSNGVRVNLKPVDFVKGSIAVSVDVDGGSLALQDKPGLETMAGAVMSLGGLEAHTADDLKSIFAGNKVGLSFGIGHRYFNFSGSTNAADLELQCKLLAAGILHPGFRTTGEEMLRRALPAQYNKFKTTTSGAYSWQAPRLIFGNDARFVTPTQEQVEACTTEDVKAALTPYLQQGAMEVSLVGDFRVEDVLPILERTFGAMPQRKAEFTQPTEAQQTVTLSPWGKSEFLRYDSRLEKTIVTQVRPAGDGMDRHRNRRLTVLANIARTRLFDDIRAKLGETYSPSVRVSTNRDYKNAAFITTASAGVVGNREKVHAAMTETLNKIGNGEISETDFDCAIRPYITRAEKSLRDADFWQAAVAHIQTDPEQLGLVRDMISDAKSITIEEIRALAKEVFGSGQVSSFFTVPAEQNKEGK